MQIAKALLLLMSGSVTVAISAGQTAKLSGIAAERSGTPLNGVRVTVRDANGKIVGQSVTNPRGQYESDAGLGKLSVECKASAILTAYATNPVTEYVEIQRSANRAKQDCTFDPVTTADSYWTQVAFKIGAKGANSPNQAIVFTHEWAKIDASRLPPTSKAAAAHQLSRMDWSSKIDSSSFKDYGLVDLLTLKKAEDGDPEALSKLPISVGNDVRAYARRTPDGVFPEAVHP